MSDTNSSIRKTLLSVKIDPRSKDEIEGLVNKLENLEKALTLSMNRVGRALAKGENIHSKTPKLRKNASFSNREAHELALNARVSVATKEIKTSRGEANVLREEMNNTMGQLGKRLQVGNNPAVVAQAMQNLNKGVGEIVEKVVNHPRSKQQQARETKTYINDEIKKNPNLKAKNSNFSKEGIQKLSARDLSNQRKATEVYLKGASKANVVAVNTQDTSFIRRSGGFKKRFENQLEDIKAEQTLRQTAAAKRKADAKKEARDQESVRKEKSNAHTKAITENNKQAETNKKNAAAKVLAAKNTQRTEQTLRKKETKAKVLSAKDTQRTEQTLRKKNAAAGVLAAKNTQRTEQTLRKNKAESGELARKEIEFQRNKAAVKFARDDKTTLAGATDARLAKNPFASKGRASLNTSLTGINGPALNDLKKSAGHYSVVIKQLIKNSSEGSKVWKEATNELIRIENRLEQIQIKKNHKPSQTEQQQAKTQAAKNALAASERRKLDGGAGQFKQQAMLLRNYAVLGGAVGLVGQSGQFMIQLEKEMKQLQSIVSLTNTEMASLSDTLINVSEKTKFTALEVTQAAVVLGQSGLGKQQIADSIEGITLFATAVGSDLKQAVDLATSTIGIFNRDASDMSNIADKLTTAVNSSKLNLDKLALGLQYAGNIAAQSNVSFEETVAALGAMANSGIRSGSTLGTGLRQVLIALQKPSEEFRRTTELLGLSMGDLDVSTNGLIPVLKKLSQSGFTVTDAMRTMQVRAAAAFGAFANNIGVADELAEKMEIGGAAARANAVQMEAFANQFARLGSTFFSLTAEAFDPMLKMTTKIVSNLADMISGLKGVGDSLQIIGGITAGLGLGALFAGLAKMGSFLFGGDSVFRSILGAGSSAPNKKGMHTVPTKSQLKSNKAMAGLTMVVKFLTKRLGTIFMALGALGGALAYLANKFDQDVQLRDTVDVAQAKTNESTSREDASRNTLKALNKAISTVSFKEELFKNEKEGAANLNEEIKTLNSKFKTLGFYIGSSVTSYEQLFDTLKTFRDDERARGFGATADRARDSLASAEAVKVEQIKNSGENSAVLAITKAFDALSGMGGTKQVEGVIAGDVIHNNYGTFTTKDTVGLIETPISGEGQDSSQAHKRSFLELASQFGALEFKNSETGEANPEAVKKGKALQDQLQSIVGELINVYSHSDILKDIESETGRPTNEVLELKNEVLDSVETLRNSFSTVMTDVTFAAENTALALTIAQERAAMTDKEVENQYQKQTKAIAAALSEISELQKITRTPDDKPRDDVEAFAQVRALYDKFLILLGDLEKGTRVRLEDGGVDPLNIAKVMHDSGITAELNKARVLLFNGLQSVLERGKMPIATQAAAETARFQALLTQLFADLNTNRTKPEQEALLTKIGETQTELSRINRQTEDIKAIDKELGPQSNDSIDNKNAQEQATVKDKAERVIARNVFSQEVQQAIKDGFKNSEFTLPLADKTFETKTLNKLIQDFVATQNNAIKKIEEDGKVEIAGYSKAEARLDKAIEDNKTITSSAGSFTEDTKLESQAALEKNTKELVALREKRAEAEERIAKDSADLAVEIETYLDNLKKANKQLSGGVEGANFDKLASAAELMTKQKNTEFVAAGVNANEVTIENTDLKNETKVSGRDLLANQFDDDVRRRLFAAMNGKEFNPIGEAQVDDKYADRDPSGILDQVRGGLVGINDLLLESVNNFDPLLEAMTGLSEIAAGLASEFAGAFKEFAMGTMSAGEAFKSFAVSVLDSMLTLAAEIAANALLKMALQAIAGMGRDTNFLDGQTMAGTPTTQMNGGRNAWNGGEIFGGSYAGGGEITRGMSTRDSVYAKVAKGEFVLRRKAVQSLGIDTVKALNSADPNLIDRQAEKLGGNPMADKKDAGNNEVNVWVVSPDEMPTSLNANDVVHIISDNMSRGGVTKQLVKRINMGLI